MVSCKWPPYCYQYFGSPWGALDREPEGFHRIIGLSAVGIGKVGLRVVCLIYWFRVDGLGFIRLGLSLNPKP